MAANMREHFGQISLDERDQQLTKYPSGSVKELSTIIWPLILSLLSTGLMGFCNRYFLSHYSIEALKAAVSAMNLALVFQVPCMRITSITQVLVARLFGAREYHQIGSVIWQVIWFSLMTMLITGPLGLLIGEFFFKNTEIESMGRLYFSSLMGANFLFPLSAALASFFVGLGSTRTIVYITLLTHLVHIALDFVLIFGISGLIEPLGAFGAAVATIIAEGFYCFLLFWKFLRKKERRFYGTANWFLQISVLKECIKLGLPRAISKLLVLAAWAASIYILTDKGGDYLLSFSAGVSLLTLFSCFNEGFGQGLMTAISFYLTSTKKESIFSILKSARILFMCGLCLLAIFLLVFPEQVIRLIFSDVLSYSQMAVLVSSCIGLWVFFLCEGLSWMGYSILNAYKDTRFIMIYTALTVFFFNYLPIYFAFCLGDWPADRLWWLMGIPCLMSALAYFYRIKTKFPLRKLTSS